MSCWLAGILTAGRSRAACWVAHHRPFPSAVLGRYGDQAVAAVFYAATLAATGVVSAVITVYVDRRGLVRPAAEAVPGLRMVRGAIGPVAFLASIPLALVSANAAEWSWGSLFVLNLALNRVARASRRRRGAPTS